MSRKKRLDVDEKCPRRCGFGWGIWSGKVLRCANYGCDGAFIRHRHKPKSKPKKQEKQAPEQLTLFNWGK